MAVDNSPAESARSLLNGIDYSALIDNERMLTRADHFWSMVRQAERDQAGSLSD